MHTKRPYYITTPIYYPSGDPHIGHCYTTLACDVVARYKRMLGYDVMFLTGTDEHGQKIEKKAQENGVSPKEYVDAYVENFQKLWKRIGITYDRYVRTTDDYHITSVQNIFKTLYDKGYIYKGEYKGKYCTPCESFWTESQLKDNACPDCGREVADAKEEAYFFKLSVFADRLEALLSNENDNFLEPKSRVNEMINNFIKPGLEDLCVSRTSFSWGVPVTFDKGHVVYVWIDALSNYISALGFKNDTYNDFDTYWPADIHVMAKEIVRFHSIIWPSMMMALDLPLPKKIYGHGWITFSGTKMGKSTGNVIDPFILADRYGVDALRYHLLREMPFGSDCPFTNEMMLNRINSDLANDLGNLVQRTVAMVIKYFDGTLPQEQEPSKEDEALIEDVLALKPLVESNYESLHISAAMSQVFKVISRANKYIDENAPWVLAKDIKCHSRLAAVLYRLLDTIRVVSVLLYPTMPHTMPEIWRQIGMSEHDATWDSTGKINMLARDVSVQKGDVLFPRLDIQKELEALGEIFASSQNDKSLEDTVKQKKPDILYTDFEKMDLRVAQVISCQKVPKSDKLLDFVLDDGQEQRRVVSGIAQSYAPEKLIGKNVLLLANLKPRKIFGIMSCGMILSADTNDGLCLAGFDRSASPGDEVS